MGTGAIIQEFATLLSKNWKLVTAISVTFVLGSVVSMVLALPSSNPESSSQVTTIQPDGTVEVTKPDGTVEVTKPDGTIEITKPDGTVEIFTPDGTIETISPDGVVTVTEPDGAVTTTTPEVSTTPAPSSSPSESSPSAPAAPLVQVRAAYFNRHPSVSWSYRSSILAVDFGEGSPTPTPSYRWFECLFIHGDPWALKGGSKTLAPDCTLIPNQTNKQIAWGAFNPHRHVLAEVTISNLGGSATMYTATHRSEEAPKEYLVLSASGSAVTGGGTITANVAWDGKQTNQAISYLWFRCTSPQAVSQTLSSDCIQHPRNQTDSKLLLWGAELYGPDSRFSDVGYYFLARVSVFGTTLPMMYTNTMGPVLQQ